VAAELAQKISDSLKQSKDPQKTAVQFAGEANMSVADMVRETAHAMKGISENLGADTVSKICTQIMHANSSELSRDWSKHFKAMTHAVHVMTKQVEAELKRLIPAPGRRNARPNED